MTYYYWDEVNDNLFGEEDENGEVSASYTHEPGLYGELIAQERDGETRYYNYDGLGNTSELTDENQNVSDTYEYSAFGEEVVRTGTTENPFGYKGALGYYTNGVTNDIYIRARTYEPKVARWNSQDSLLFEDGPNWYQYVANSPINGVDPTGKQLLPPYDSPVECCGDCRCGIISVTRGGPSYGSYTFNGVEYYYFGYLFNVTVPTTGNCDCFLTQYIKGTMSISNDGGNTWSVLRSHSGFDQDGPTCPSILDWIPEPFVQNYRNCKRKCVTATAYHYPCIGSITYRDAPGYGYRRPAYANDCLKWDYTIKICCNDSLGAHCKSMVIKGQKCKAYNVPSILF